MSPRSSYTDHRHNASNSGFRSALTSLMSAGFSKRAKSNVRIAAEHINTYTLDNSDEWFEEAVLLPATRSWFERAVDRGDRIYMVVGYHTITDARISQESIQGEQTSGQLALPASLSLAAAGVVAPLGNLIDTAVGANRENLNGAQSHFMAPGEQVCALQYRKVHHKWLSSKMVDTLRLSKAPRWLSIETRRAMEEEDDDEDIIEVQMEEMDGPDGEWDAERLPDGEVLLVRA